ncbi:hypothetical protein AX15_005550 [Amanita polypyramis BW_CC]|nr:hypothetical protein AX15_005550 [Amanita polypyramis BW_CC]
MGNWEAELDKLQINYAANDAHCALRIYGRLLELAQQNEIELNEDLIKKQCSSSVSCPRSKQTNQAPSRAPSCPDIPITDGASRSGSLQRHETMPNMTTTQASRIGLVNMRPQQLRAYQFWYKRGMTLERMCVELSLKSMGYTGLGFRNTASEAARSSGNDIVLSEDEKDNKATTMDSNALKPSTVISYVIGALQADSELPFDMEKLRELVQMDTGSWERHRDWILRTWGDGRGVMY